jgi:excisionase family DNA binding protein
VSIELATRHTPHQPDPPAGNGAALLLRSRDAARALAIGERKLWELTKRNLIPCVRIGRSVRYSLPDLQAWIEAQKHSGPASATGPPT